MHDGTHCQSDPFTTARVFLDDHSRVLCLGSCNVCFFLWCVYKKNLDPDKNFEPLYADVAGMESALDTLQKQMRPRHSQEELSRSCATHAEIRGEINMVSDSAENTQWGLIKWVAIPFSMQLHQASGSKSTSRTMGMQ